MKFSFQSFISPMVTRGLHLITDPNKLVGVTLNDRMNAFFSINLVLYNGSYMPDYRD